MVSRTIALFSVLAATAAAGVQGQVPKTYPTTFGLASPIIATGDRVTATYFGWERTTVFGHGVFALTGAEYAADLANDCFNFYSIFRTGCRGGGEDLGALQGLGLFNKPLGVTCPAPDPSADLCLGSPIATTFGWTPGTEVIFALMVNQGENDYNWFFSGDPSRNVDGFAHLAFFPSIRYPDGVPGNRGIGVVPQTAGLSLFGFEDVNYRDSDWDFNNAIFGLDNHTIAPPSEVVPEPATLTLIAAGLLGLGTLAGRRHRRNLPPA